MKKLIHLGMFAMIALAISSCSKSTNDMVAKEKETPSKSASPRHDMNPTPDDYNHAWSSIYPFINQPVSLGLGSPDNNLYTGDIVVFYILLADDAAVGEANNATLTLMDYDNNNEYIQSYPFIPGPEAESYGVLAPEELAGRPFMFSVVELDNRYTGKTITLRSDIDLDEMASAAKLDHAFTVRDFIIRHN